MFFGLRPGTYCVQNAVSVAFSLGANVTTISPYGVLDIKLNGSPGAGNNYGLIPDVTVMSIIGNGNVGIGVTIPVYKFHVAGTSIFGYVAGSKKGIVISNEDSYGTNPCIQGVSSSLGTNDLSIQPGGGNVGIGTANPNYLLDIYGSNPTLRIRTSTGAYSSGTATLLFDSITASYPLAKIAGIDMGVSPGVYRSDLAFYYQYNGILTEGMRLMYNGYVGIGTTTPAALLHVYNSNASFTGAPTVQIGDGQIDSGGTYGMLQLVRGNNGDDNKAHLAFIKNGLTLFGMGYYPGASQSVFGLVPSFGTMATNTGLWIATNGYVGIQLLQSLSMMHQRSTINHKE
jgi:hypothetical protein